MATEDEVKLVETAVCDVPEIVARLRAGFRSHKTLELSYRKAQLRNLKRLLEENEKQILEALWKDLRKGESEAVLMEINLMVTEIVTALNNLEDWVAPKPQPKDLINKFNSVYVQAEPYGVVLNIAAWNFPFLLTLSPLIGAIAAGNTCLLKPSEVSACSANLVMELVPKYLDPECYAVVNGGVPIAQALLKERFDYIMYTGSTAVAKVVMAAAAQYITPVTLELGGKSPALVVSDANLDAAGRRITFGRFVNAGQMCIGVDYVLCMKDQRDKLVDVIKNAITEFFGENPKESLDFGRVVNDRHFRRVVSMLESTKGMVVCGGETDEATRYIAPTVIVDVSLEDKLMQDEIFGPLLPIVTVESLDEAIAFINEREKPLTMYVFTESKRTFQMINKLTSSGGVCHNDTIMQAAVPSLPFGGVGNSGFGCYHFKHTFDTFSHYKGVLSTMTSLESLNKIRYPPSNKTKLNRLKWLLTPKERDGGLPWRLMILFLLVAILAVTVQMFGIPDWIQQLRQ